MVVKQIKMTRSALHISGKSEKETKCIKELVTTAIQSKEISKYHYLLSKSELHKTLAWIYRFINNSGNVKNSCLLTTEEIERRRIYLMKQAQMEVEHCETFINNKKRLNQRKILEGI